MRQELCPDCKGSGSQSFCEEHNSKPGWVCECFSCAKCEGYGKLKVVISGEELNKLTLKVNQLLTDSGIPAKYNEDNNVMRHYLYEFLTKWLDCEVDKKHTSSYVVWGDLRKQFNLPNPFVKD